MESRSCRVALEGVLVGDAGEGLSTGTPANLLSAVLLWLRQEHSSMLCGVREWIGADATAHLSVRLHPNDTGVCWSACTEHTLRVDADTLPVGPGYRHFLGRLLHDLGEDLQIQWSSSPRISPMAASEEGQQGLVEVARAALSEITNGRSRPSILMSGQHRYAHGLLVSTPLGPRGMEWLAAAAVGRVRLDDVFPWPAAGFGPRYLRGRALSLMWTQVRWRAPLTDDELAAVSESDGLLREAWTAEPNQDMPWRAWAELQRILELDTGLAREVRERAAVMAQESGAHRIGYRRRAVDVSLPGGWWVRVPGELAEGWEDGDTWCAWDDERTLWVSVMRGEDAETAPRDKAAPGAVFFESDGVRGVAERSFVAEDGGVQVLSGRVFSDAGMVVISACHTRPEHAAWAEECWRSLRCDTLAVARRGAEDE